MAKITNGEEVEPTFENEAEEEIEFKDAEEEAADPDEGLPEDVKKASKKDLYEKVKALEEKAASSSIDPTERITGAFEKALGGLRPQAAPAPAQPAGESEAEFIARLKKDLFDEEKAPGLLNELIDRRLGPRLQQTMELNFSQAQKLVELDPETGPVYKKYKGEIEGLLATLPANVQKTPQALDYVLRQVKSNHIQDIAQEMANRMLEEERKKTPARREPLSLETGSGGGASAAASAAPRKKIVTITQADREKADELGVDASVIAARRARSVS